LDDDTSIRSIYKNSDAVIENGKQILDAENVRMWKYKSQTVMEVFPEERDRSNRRSGILATVPKGIKPSAAGVALLSFARRIGRTITPETLAQVERALS
jgi:hypothetical protein